MDQIGSGKYSKCRPATDISPDIAITLNTFDSRRRKFENLLNSGRFVLLGLITHLTFTPQVFNTRCDFNKDAGLETTNLPLILTAHTLSVQKSKIVAEMDLHFYFLTNRACLALLLQLIMLCPRTHPAETESDRIESIQCDWQWQWQNPNLLHQNATHWQWSAVKLQATHWGKPLSQQLQSSHAPAPPKKKKKIRIACIQRITIP